MAKAKTKNLHKDVAASANKVWLAGLGALATAEEEGAKLFRTLVKKGEEYEAKGRAGLEKVKDSVVSAGAKAEKAWDNVSDSLDDQVAAVMARLGVPMRDEIATLAKRVEELTALVEKAKAPKVKTPARR